MRGELPDEIVIDDILPPGQKSSANHRPSAAQGPAESEVARILARWLDNWLRIPGTDFKIGLDPILSFFPGIGSTVASGGGIIILIEAIRSGISLPVLIRMGGNLLLNTLFDFVPFLGPVASAFFKSNHRNLKLLQTWQAGHQQVVKQSTTRFFAIAGLFVLLLVGMLTGLFFFYVWLLRELISPA